MDKNNNNIVYNADGYINYDWVKPINTNTSVPIINNVDTVKIKIKTKKNVALKYNMNVIYQQHFC
jgi:hypothetical protein